MAVFVLVTRRALKTPARSTTAPKGGETRSIMGAPLARSLRAREPSNGHPAPVTFNPPFILGDFQLSHGLRASCGKWTVAGETRTGKSSSSRLELSHHGYFLHDWNRLDSYIDGVSMVEASTTLWTAAWGRSHVR